MAREAARGMSVSDRWEAIERARTPEELTRVLRGRTHRRRPSLPVVDGILGLAMTLLLLAAVVDALLR
jgi:hypothetical protein